jgi:hypothetical protein
VISVFGGAAQLCVKLYCFRTVCLIVTKQKSIPDAVYNDDEKYIIFVSELLNSTKKLLLQQETVLTLWRFFACDEQLQWIERAPIDDFTHKPCIVSWFDILMKKYDSIVTFPLELSPTLK